MPVIIERHKTHSTDDLVLQISRQEGGVWFHRTWPWHSDEAEAVRIVATKAARLMPKTGDRARVFMGRSGTRLISRGVEDLVAPVLS